MGVEDRRLRHMRYKESEKRATEEIRVFWLGEPSTALFQATEIEAEDVTGHVLFEAPKAEKESPADLVKKRAKNGMNFILEHPQAPRSPEGLDSLVYFLQNKWERMRKFGRTLKNKGRLNPVAERELGL